MKFCFEQKDFIEEGVNPDKLAIVGDDFSLSWEEFSSRVTALCKLFKSKNWSHRPVIIYGHKSSNMLVAIYAMMKLEIPYIPLDQIYPIERIQKIQAIAKSEIVINTTQQALGLDASAEIMLSENDTRVVDFEPMSPLKKDADPLVYIIFTSGSTGEPKGVQISSEAVQSFTRWMSNDFGFSAEDVFINTAVLSFDLSVFEVMTFGALGATILLNNKSQSSDPNELIPRIEKYQGSVWVSTPSFALIYSRMKGDSRLDSLRYFLFCGEVLPHDLASKLIEHFPLAKVYNTYGPTEATVATTLVEIDQNVLDSHNPLPVGFAKRESQLVIDSENQIVIVGPHVSKGYVNNAELNELKFVKIEGQRAFKTGDHGYLENGMLFFSGRNDDLVKLHGYRIELNEISSAIRNLDYVLQGETIALKRNGSVKKIVSLVKLAESEPIDVKAIKEDIASVLPHYMIPSDIKVLDHFPLNQNGKPDKKKLMEMYLNR